MHRCAGLALHDGACRSIEPAPMKAPRHVAPTLASAVLALSDREERGFVFVRADGTERFCSFAAICREASLRGADFHARGLTKGDRVAIVVPDPDEFVLTFL